jgi:small subunit ribosomal protein S2
MISDKAFSNEYDEVTPLATDSHFIGEGGEDDTLEKVYETAGIAEVFTEDDDDDEIIDLNAVLGGGIRKAPIEEESSVDESEVFSDYHTA